MSCIFLKLIWLNEIIMYYEYIIHIYVYWLQKEIEQWWKKFLNQRKENINMQSFTQSCLTLRNSMDCSLPSSSVHGIFQAKQRIKIPIDGLVNILPFFFFNEHVFKTYVIHNVDVKPQKITLKAIIILWHAFFFLTWYWINMFIWLFIQLSKYMLCACSVVSDSWRSHGL